MFLDNISNNSASKKPKSPSVSAECTGKNNLNNLFDDVDNFKTYNVSKFLDSEFKKQILRHIMYFKVELQHILSNQNENSERLLSIENLLEGKSKNYMTNLETICMSDCPLPIDSEIDLNTLEDKALRDLEFKNNLVNTNTKLLLLLKCCIFYIIIIICQ